MPPQIKGGSSLQRGDRQFIHAQRTEEGILPDALKGIASPRQDSCLRAPHQLVAAESGNIDSGFQAHPCGRLVLHSPGSQVHQAAAAQIFHEQHAVLPGQLHELIQAGPFCETQDTKVAGVDAQQHPRALIDGRRIVAGAGAVGGADLA